MGNFTKWIEQNYGSMPGASPTTSLTPQNQPMQPPVTPPNPQAAANPALGNDFTIEELKLMPMLSKTLNRFMDTLMGYKIDKRRAIKLVSYVIGEIQKQTGVSDTQVRQGMAQNKMMQKQNPMQP